MGGKKWELNSSLMVRWEVLTKVLGKFIWSIYIYLDSKWERCVCVCVFIVLSLSFSLLFCELSSCFSAALLFLGFLLLLYHWTESFNQLSELLLAAPLFTRGLPQQVAQLFLFLFFLLHQMPLKCNFVHHTCTCILYLDPHLLNPNTQ